MKLSKKPITDVQEDELLLTTVRKVHNTDPNGKHNYKLQIEGAQFIKNPYRPVNAVSVFNEGDSRFAGTRARRAWVTIEPQNWERFFPGTYSLKELEKLEFSSRQDGLEAKDLKDGVHTLYLGISNPTFNVHGKMMGLGAVIIESTVKRNDRSVPKRNPARTETDPLGEIQTVGNQPIYVQSTLDFCTIGADGKKIVPASRFLVSDQMRKAVAEGRLLIDLHEEVTTVEVPTGEPELQMKKKDTTLA